MSKTPKSSKLTPAIVPGRKQEAQAPKHWGENTVVVSHSQIREMPLMDGAPIKIEFMSGHTVFRLYDSSTPNELFYWERDKGPTRKQCSWVQIRRVTVLSLFDLVSVGNFYATPTAAPSNGKIQ